MACDQIIASPLIRKIFYLKIDQFHNMSMTEIFHDTDLCQQILHGMFGKPFLLNALYRYNFLDWTLNE